MDALMTYFKVRPEKHKYYIPDKYLYVTIVDGYRKSLLLPHSKVQSFLNKYSTTLKTLSEHARLHFNVILTALPQHILYIDVDYPTPTTADQAAADSLRLYHVIVAEIKQHMTIMAPTSDFTFDAFHLTRDGTTNFHLIFPHLSVSRVDYAYLISKLSPWHVDLVHGWMMHGSCKRASQKPYRVTGRYRDAYAQMLTMSDTESILQSAHRSKLIDYIYTHLFFPIELGWFRTCVPIRYPIRISLQLNPHYIVRYADAKKQMCYLYLTHATDLTELPLFDQDLFTFCKNNQNEYEFQSNHPVIHTYIHKFSPPKIVIEDVDDTAALVATTARHDDDDEDPVLTDGFMKDLYATFEDNFTPAQFYHVWRDYERHYSCVLQHIYHKTCDGSYTSRSLLYELAYRHGEEFTIPSVFIAKRQLHTIRKMFYGDDIELFNQYLSDHVIPTLPLKVNVGTKDTMLFHWAERAWLKIPLSVFINIFINTLLDYIIIPVQDSELRTQLRKIKRAFLNLPHLDSRLIYLFITKQIPFDHNPMLLGLRNNEVLDLVTCTSRPMIPEDLITKKANYSFDYQDRSLFRPFLDKDTYQDAFGALKQYLEETNHLQGFSFTGVTQIDDLFAFLAPVFCDEYEEMIFFLEFVAQAFKGRNYFRWILFLLGSTSNSKTTLAKLIMEVLGEYSGILSPAIFYQSAKPMGGGEPATPQLNARLLDRICVVEELSSVFPLNVAILNSYSGNNRIYSRQLYQSGGDSDIHFTLCFTTNSFPNVSLTPALAQRIKILKFNSLFLLECKHYDFKLRRFPQCLNLNLEYYGKAFMSLIIHTLHGIQERPPPGISIPESVTRNLNELAHGC